MLLFCKKKINSVCAKEEHSSIHYTASLVYTFILYTDLVYHSDLYIFIFIIILFRQVNVF